MCLSFCDLKILSPKKYRKEGKSNIRIHIFKNPAWLFLVCSGCCNRIPQMGRLKQWAFISHSSREGSPRSGCWWIRFLQGALFQVCRWPPSCCVLTWWGEHLCCVSSYKGTNPIHGVPPSWSFPETPPPRDPEITWGLGFQHVDFGGTQIFSPWQTPMWYVLKMLILTIHLKTHVFN